MSLESTALRAKAQRTLATAARLVDDDAESAVSRAYYAAFHAVSAYFALTGISFRKHTAAAAAVHRDLVRAGRWPVELGEAYSILHRARSHADYGGIVEVDVEGAREAVERARLIISAVHGLEPGAFPME